MPAFDICIGTPVSKTNINSVPSKTFRQVLDEGRHELGKAEWELVTAVHLPEAVPCPCARRGPANSA